MIKAKWIRRILIILKCATAYQLPSITPEWWISQKAKQVKIRCEEADVFTLPRKEFYGLPHLFDWLGMSFSFIIFPCPPEGFSTKKQLWLEGKSAYHDWTCLWPFWVSLRGIWKE